MIQISKTKHVIYYIHIINRMANTYPRNMILRRRVAVVGKVHANSVDVCIIHKYDTKINHLFALVSKILLLSIIVINKWKRKM